MKPELERKLLAEIYAAGRDPARWSGGIAKMRTAVPGTHVQVFGYGLGDGSAILSATHGYEYQYHESFEAHYSSVNSWAPGWSNSPVGRYVTSEQMVPRDLFKRSEF